MTYTWTITLVRLTVLQKLLTIQFWICFQLKSFKSLHKSIIPVSWGMGVKPYVKPHLMYGLKVDGQTAKQITQSLAPNLKQLLI